MSQRKICLVVIFNHRYDKNVEQLDHLYKDKFSNIFFLMPFYTGDDERVIPVYESSIYFQGFFMQGLNRYYDDDYTHYVFVADDLLLNAHLNEHNIIEELNLPDDAGYMKHLTPLSDESFQWEHTLEALQTIESGRTRHYVKYESELPDYAEAVRILARHNLEWKGIGWRNMRGWRGWERYPAITKAASYILKRQLKQWRDHYVRKQSPRQTYPLVMGYSDFFIVPATAIESFCRYCAVFGAMNMFVEAAIPTAMAFSCAKIVSEQDNFSEWRGVEIWSQEEIENLLKASDFSLRKLIASYDEHQLYLHPVKLSRRQASEI